MVAYTPDHHMEDSHHHQQQQQGGYQHHGEGIAGGVHGGLQYENHHGGYPDGNYGAGECFCIIIPDYTYTQSSK